MRYVYIYTYTLYMYYTLQIIYNHTYHFIGFSPSESHLPVTLT